MICDQCNGPTEVIDSRLHVSGIRRRRACGCGHRFTTWETTVRPAKPARDPAADETRRAERAAQAKVRRARMADEDKAALRLRQKLRRAGVEAPSH